MHDVHDLWFDELTTVSLRYATQQLARRQNHLTTFFCLLFYKSHYFTFAGIYFSILVCGASLKRGRFSHIYLRVDKVCYLTAAKANFLLHRMVVLKKY